MLTGNARSPLPEPVRTRAPDGSKFSPFLSRKKIPSDAKSKGGETYQCYEKPSGSAAELLPEDAESPGHDEAAAWPGRVVAGAREVVASLGLPAHVRVVVQIYYPAQFAIFYTARFSSGPWVLYQECLLYALRHIYTSRHMGLTLAGRDDAELAASGSMRQSSTDVAASSDADHAQAGPSTGGYSIELGTTTVHAVSGAHHATTLGATDSESYEVLRAVATTVAFRSFMTELGFPQPLAYP